MTIVNLENQIAPKIGDGIFSAKDIAMILDLDYPKVKRWMLEYWDNNLKKDFNYTFGEKTNKAINFYSLVEFFTFFKLRDAKVGASTIRKLHEELSDTLNSPYPFAIANDLFVEKKKNKTFVFVKHLNNLFKVDGKKQLYLDFIESFLQKIEFGDNNMAIQFYPLGKNKSVVVDPKRQFGRPIIIGTNIRTETIYDLHLGGETIANICKLYELTTANVEDAIHFHLKSAA
jgi:uncharacterized protein (DUF433 family)